MSANFGGQVNISVFAFFHGGKLRFPSSPQAQKHRSCCSEQFQSHQKKKKKRQKNISEILFKKRENKQTRTRKIITKSLPPRAGFYPINSQTKLRVSRLPSQSWGQLTPYFLGSRSPRCGAPGPVVTFGFCLRRQISPRAPCPLQEPRGHKSGPRAPSAPRSPTGTATGAAGTGGRRGGAFR